MKVNMKEILLPLVFLILLLNVAKVGSAELPLLASGSHDYLNWEVRAFEEVEVGDDFSIVFTFESWSDLDIRIINVTVYGVIGPQGEWDYWRDSWSEITMYKDVTYTKTAYFTAIREGSVYGVIHASFKDVSGDDHHLYTNFGITEIHSTAYQELKDSYESLNQTYMDLQASYNSLESAKNNIVSIFIATTLGIIGISIYLALKWQRATRKS